MQVDGFAGRRKKAYVMNDKRIRDISIAQYLAGGYSAVQFLSSVCHFSESVTNVLTRDDDGSSTEEYDLRLTDDEDNGHSNGEVTAAATVTPAAASVPTIVTFVSLQQAKTLLSCHVDNGHALTFCKQCVETLVAVNGHCPICRGPIDTTVQFYNN